MVAHQLASAYAVPSGNTEKQGVRPNINVSDGHLTVDGLSGALPSVDRGGPLLWSTAPLILRSPDAVCKTPVKTANGISSREGEKTHTYYALVESVRTEAGPRQRVVAHLGELNHDQERRWQRTVVFHNRQGENRQLRLFPDDEQVCLPDDPDVVRISLESVGWAHPRRFGDVWLGLKKSRTRNNCWNEPADCSKEPRTPGEHHEKSYQCP